MDDLYEVYIEHEGRFRWLSTYQTVYLKDDFMVLTGRASCNHPLGQIIERDHGALYEGRALYCISSPGAASRWFLHESTNIAISNQGSSLTIPIRWQGSSNRQLHEQPD